MAQSRYGSAGELLAWRPDRVGHEALMPVGEPRRGVAPGLWQGSASVQVTMRTLTRLANRRLEGKTLKWHYSRPL